MIARCRGKRGRKGGGRIDSSAGRRGMGEDRRGEEGQNQEGKGQQGRRSEGGAGLEWLVYAGLLLPHIAAAAAAGMLLPHITTTAGADLLLPHIGVGATHNYEC